MFYNHSSPSAVLQTSLHMVKKGLLREGEELQIFLAFSAFHNYGMKDTDGSSPLVLPRSLTFQLLGIHKLQNAE